MYDVYLFKGVHDLPTLETLEQIAPELKESATQQQLMLNAPHFLGMELDANAAIKLLRYLRNAKAIGYIVPSAYRQPRATIEQATQIAEKAIAQLKETRYPNEPLDPTHFVREEPVSWVFAATHGGKTKKVYVHVDKLDGHLWQPGQLEQLWNETYFLENLLENLDKLEKTPYVITVEEPDKGYDIYLTQGASTLATLKTLPYMVPILNRRPSLQQQLVQGALLDLAVSKDRAVDFFQSLKDKGAEGYIVPVAYKYPRITIEQANLLAERYFKQIKARERPYDTLGPTHFKKEEPVWWLFAATSAQFLKEDRIPALLFAHVDKLDGHIWEKVEIMRLWEGN